MTQAPAAASRILVVDDTPANLQTLAAILKEKGYRISVATNGRQALEVVEKVEPDLILLDVMMPEMDGFETCRRLKASEKWHAIPIIFLTARTETADIVRGFELGAVDYVAKPFNAHEFLARVHTHLTMDHLRRENERLLLNILPGAIADRLRSGEEGIADRFDEVTVLFADIVGFTEMASAMPARRRRRAPQRPLLPLRRLAARELGIEKIKTIGDAYMVVCGLPEPAPITPTDGADGAWRSRRSPAASARSVARRLRLRIGIDTGPGRGRRHRAGASSSTTSGATRSTLASRMETHGVPGAIQVTRGVYGVLQGLYPFEARGFVEVKGKGLVEAWTLSAP